LEVSLGGETGDGYLEVHGIFGTTFGRTQRYLHCPHWRRSKYPSISTYLLPICKDIDIGIDIDIDI
jgi:hypothetical protein